MRVCVYVRRPTCKAVESGRGQIALSFVDELNKVISGFLECYHRVQENWLVEQSRRNFQDPVIHSPCTQSRVLWRNTLLAWKKISATSYGVIANSCNILLKAEM